MRIMMVDIDSLRPDHLGCYGYRRATSPTIDGLAQQGRRMANAYASDVPCLPTRTSLHYGCCGYQHGAVNHGGTRAEPYGSLRGNSAASLRSQFCQSSLASQLRRAGLRTATVSAFADRHSAFHFLSGFDEVFDTGHGGHDDAQDVTPKAIDWLERHGAEDNWFLHVLYWDVHIPYRTPNHFGRPFEQAPPPDFPTQHDIDQSLARPGLRSAQDMMSVRSADPVKNPLQPRQVRQVEDAWRMVEGYDTEIRYVDGHIAQSLDTLAQQGIADDVAIIVTADHDEGLGELSSYCGHNLADEHTAHVPLIIRWPGVTNPGPAVDGLVYQLDLAATILDLLGSPRPDAWQSQSFAAGLRGERFQGRDFVVISQLAQMCQRAVRFTHDGDAYLLLRTYHDGFQGFDDVELYNLSQEPHETHNIRHEQPAIAQKGMQLLGQWYKEQRASTAEPDPILAVLTEMPQPLVGVIQDYIQRLRDTGRGQWADRFIDRHLV